MKTARFKRPTPTPQPFGNLFYLAPPHAYFRPATADELIAALMHERGVVYVEANGVERSFYIEGFPVAEY